MEVWAPDFSRKAEVGFCEVAFEFWVKFWSHLKLLLNPFGILQKKKKKKRKRKMNKTEKVINRRVQIASLSNEKFYRFFKIKSCSGTLSFHSISTLGRLNNTTTKSRRTGKKSNTEVWISKTRTFHEPLHAFLYIS